MRRSLFSSVWLGSLLIIAMSVVLAQDAICALAAPEVIDEANQVCENLNVGEACVGAGSIRINGDTESLEIGTQLTINDIQSLETEDGIFVMRVQADLPEDAPPLTLIAYGNTHLASLVQNDLPSPLPTVTIQNPGLYVLNFRDQPNKYSYIVGTFEIDQAVIADGRSADNAWVHVQTPTGVAWISTSVVNVVGELQDLAVLESHYIYPWQDMTLVTDTHCGGFVVQSSAEPPVRLRINNADTSLTAGALVASAQPNATLDLRVLAGDVTVRMDTLNITAKQKESLQIELGGEDGLQAVGEPRNPELYPFVTIADAPISMLPSEAGICLVGVTNAEDDAQLYNGPGDPYSPIAALNAEPYLVNGQNSAEDGSSWWRVDQRQWVAQDAVLSVGQCTNITEVPPPTLVTIAGSNQSVVHNFLPGGTSVWQAGTSADTLSGTCKTPPIAQCNHLAAITPDGRGGISWRGQEAQPYPMGPVGNDTFAYSGRNQLGNANLTWSLAFTGEGSWQGQMQLVYDEDPTCTHTFYYSATRVR